ncbi:right-handed parallel beta-helix repeat-containing protein [Methanosarcina mazei]|uniref:right-handed parallel beta-helix repeat-containing protein n=1 Tax=Methanosarcina mazei TaxID=2209 RepID=UPI00138E0883|nr:right-handed parallel beta-helix repeat-containing protein [Methanosarcina mazei]
MGTNGSGKIKKYVILLFFLIIILSIFFTSSPTVPIVYVSGNNSGDFNCNGIDDQVQINQALAYVAENPEFTTVYLKGPNTYNVNDTIYIGNNTILEGDSSAIIKLVKQSQDLPTPKENRAIIKANGNSTNNITIRGFEIDGNKLNSWSVWDLDHYNMIQLYGSSNVTINDMYFHNGLGDAIKLRQGSRDNYIHPDTNIHIYNNTIYKIGHDGIYMFCVSNMSIHDNVITCRDDAGIRLFNSNNARIYNNSITSENQGGAGIQIQKKDSPIIDDIEICDNRISNIRTIGIWILGYGQYNYGLDCATGIHIHHNIIYNSGTNVQTAGGIVIQGFNNTLIENNVIDGNYKYGIAHDVYPEDKYSFPPGSGYVTIVRNNIITSTKADSSMENIGYGIDNELSETHRFVLENNCLYNNANGNYKNASSATDLNVDPLFVNVSIHDYHLKSKAGHWSVTGWVADTVSSPCIDAGSPSSDYSHEPEDNGNRINMGAYGNTKYASKSETYEKQ